MSLPSIKTLEAAFPGHGVALRTLLSSNNAVREHPAVKEWVSRCVNQPKLFEMRLCALDAEMGGFGVDYVSAGSNARCPAINYINMGDSYNMTVLRINGHYSVGDVGSLLERPGYENSLSYEPDFRVCGAGA